MLKGRKSPGLTSKVTDVLPYWGETYDVVFMMRSVSSTLHTQGSALEVVKYQCYLYQSCSLRLQVE